MSFDWSKFLSLAEGMHEASQSAQSDLEEAFCRTVIGRAYYAAFNLSYFNMELIWGSNAARGADKHEWTYLKYASCNYPDVQKRNSYLHIGANLKRLRIMRNQADYDTIVQGSVKNKAGVAIALAQDIVEELAKNPNRVI